MKSNNLSLITLALQISLACARIRHDLGGRNVLVAEFNPAIDRLDEFNRRVIIGDVDTGFKQTFSCENQGKELAFSPDRRFVGCCFRSEALRGSPQTAFDCCGVGHELTGSEWNGYSCCPMGQDFDGRMCRSSGEFNQRPTNNMNAGQNGRFPMQGQHSWQHEHSNPFENVCRPGQGDQMNYGRQPGYSEQMSYGRQPGCGEQMSYGRQPGFGEQMSYGRQPGYGEQTSYGRQPGYGEQMNYGRHPGYGEQMNYGRQPGYGDHMNLGRQPPQSDNANHGRQPIHGEHMNNNNRQPWMSGRPEQCSSGLVSGKCYIFTAENGQRLGYKRNGEYYSADRDSRDHQFGKFQLCITEACETSSPINPNTGFHIRDIHGDANGGQNAGRPIYLI